MANPLLDRLDLDDVLVKFKVYDRYHAVTSVFLTLALALDFMWYYNHVFVIEKVGYRCLAFNPEAKEINSSNISNTHNNAIAWCRNPDSCSEWVYDNSNSFVAEFGLACQDWKRTSVGSVHIFGYMMGVFIVGLLSDRFGRKTLLIILLVSGGLLGASKSFVTSYWPYVALEFLEAAIGDPMSPIFTLAMEMVATKTRVTYTTICNAGLGFGGILYALLAWLSPYWRTLLKITYAPGLLFIFLIYWLDESPRWNLAKGKKSAAVKTIRKYAKISKVELEEDLNNISYEKEKESGFLTVLRDTFKSRKLLKRFFVCSIWWIVATFVNFGLIVNSTLLKGNKYINFGLLGVMKITGILIAAYIVNKLNRRRPLILCFVACAILCTVQPFIPKNLVWLQVINYMAGTLLSSMCLYMIYIFTAELFPTQSRNSMHALCSSIGRTGSIIAPHTPLLMAYWSGLPTMVFGSASLTAGLVTLLVPDTANQNLPDTVGQAENMETK